MKEIKKAMRYEGWAWLMGLSAKWIHCWN